MSAIINSFGKNLRGDDNSLNMMDLIAFRCQVAIDDSADIPENLDITLGDITVHVVAQIKKMTPFGDDNRGTSFLGRDQNEDDDHMDPSGRRLARRVNLHGKDVWANNSTEGDDTGNSGT